MFSGITITYEGSLGLHELILFSKLVFLILFSESTLIMKKINSHNFLTTWKNVLAPNQLFNLKSILIINSWFLSQNGKYSKNLRHLKLKEVPADTAPFVESSSLTLFIVLSGRMTGMKLPILLIKNAKMIFLLLQDTKT